MANIQGGKKESNLDKGFTLETISSTQNRVYSIETKTEEWL